MAAIEALHRKFPYGWEVLPTSSEGFYCIFYAFIGSIEAQYPGVPLADVQRDLVSILDAPELAYARDALEGCRNFATAQNPSSREAQETNKGHLLFDHGMAAVYHWYRNHHGIDIAAGLIRRSCGYRDRAPQFYDTDTTSESSLSVWIECDMALDNVVEKLMPEPPAGEELPMNHFSNLRAKSASAPLAPLPTGDLTPGPNQVSQGVAPMMPKKKTPHGQAQMMQMKLVLLPKRPADSPKYGSVGKASGNTMASPLRGASSPATCIVSKNTGPDFMVPTASSLQSSSLMPTGDGHDFDSTRATALLRSSLPHLFASPAKKRPRTAYEGMDPIPPSPTRLVKPKQTGPGVQPPRPASRIEDASLIPTLRARYRSIEDQIMGVDPEFQRLAEVERGLSDMRYAAFRGDERAFSEALECLRAAMEWPTLA